MVDIGKFTSPMDPIHVQRPGNESWMFKQVIWKTTPGILLKVAQQKQTKTHDLLGTTATHKVSSPVNC